jgi:hypothetical protein
MDEIISKFESFSTQEPKKNDIDLLIEQIQAISIFDPEKELKELKSNFNKLVYFKQVIKNLDSTAFKPALESFMDKLDSVNQYYLENVSFDISDYRNDSYSMYDLDSIADLLALIKDSLEESLQINDPCKKLEHVLSAYSYILEFIQDYTNIKLETTDIEHLHTNKKLKRK